MAEEIRLSAEEYAYLLFLHGAAPAAGRVLQQLDAELNEDQIEQRLLTAGHALLAHGLCTISATAVEPTEEIAALIADAASTPLALQATVATRQASAEVLYYPTANGLLAQTVLAGVVYAFRRFGDVGALTTTLIADLPTVGFLPEMVQVTLTRAQLDAAQAGGNTAETAAMLRNLGMAQAPALALAADLVGERFRGSLLRIVSKGTEAPVGERGRLLLGGRYLWLLEPLGAGEHLVIEAATPQRLTAVCADLLAPAA